MAVSKTITNAEDVIKSVGIPPQPEVLLKIKKEIEGVSPNLLRIADLVSQDVGLSASTIKVASSPIIGLGKVKTIMQALNLLGTKNFYNLILTSALRETLTLQGLDSNFFEGFWKHSLLVAKGTQAVCKRVNKRLLDEGYLVGLFHDCAVPIMLKRFNDYNQIALTALSPSTKAILVEEKLYHTNHCVVGYVLAKSWQLPYIIIETIMWHHSSELKYLKDDTVKLLVQCLRFAELLLQLEIDTACSNAGATEDTCQLVSEQVDTKEAKSIANDIQQLTDSLKLSELAVEEIRDTFKEMITL